MVIVCVNDLAMGSFTRIFAKISRSLGACMEPPLTSPVIDLDNHNQGLDDFDDNTLTQPPIIDTNNFYF